MIELLCNKQTNTNSENYIYGIDISERTDLCYD